MKSIPYSVLTTGGKVGDGKRIVCMGRRAPRAPRHNGNQESVYEAVKNGHRTPRDIRRATGLGVYTVGNALRRLLDASRIKKVGSSEYTLVDRVPLLARLW